MGGGSGRVEYDLPRCGALGFGKGRKRFYRANGKTGVRFGYISYHFFVRPVHFAADSGSRCLPVRLGQDEGELVLPTVYYASDHTTNLVATDFSPCEVPPGAPAGDVFYITLRNTFSS